jgi:hypothetical protein
VYRLRDAERLTGIGAIRGAGRVVIEAIGYVVHVEQAMLAAGRGEVPGMFSAHGYLVFDQYANPIPFPLIGADVELELADGRVWPCIIQSSSGTLVGRGPISSSSVVA